MSPQIENEDLTPSSVPQISPQVGILHYEAGYRQAAWSIKQYLYPQDSPAPNISVEGMEKKEEHPYFSWLFKFMCVMAVVHYLFSIGYTYVYYPSIWKNVIEGYMEV